MENKTTEPAKEIINVHQYEGRYRDAFEAYESGWRDIKRRPDGLYRSQETRIAWAVWWAACEVFGAKEEAAIAKIDRIRTIALTADGWEDGETFYKSAIESIRDVLGMKELKVQDSKNTTADCPKQHWVKTTGADGKLSARRVRCCTLRGDSGFMLKHWKCVGRDSAECPLNQQEIANAGQ